MMLATIVKGLVARQARCLPGRNVVNIETGLLFRLQATMIPQSRQSHATPILQKAYREEAPSSRTKRKMYADMRRRKRIVVSHTNENLATRGWRVCKAYDLERVENVMLKSPIKEKNVTPFEKALLDTELLPHVRCYKCSLVDETSDYFVFVFRNGSLVTWGLSYAEYVNIMRSLLEAARGAFDEALVESELEVIPYRISNSPTALSQDAVGHEEIWLRGVGQTDRDVLERFAVSHALALSGMLGTWENSVQKSLERSQNISEQIQMNGRLSMNRTETLKWIGYIFSIRAALNRTDIPIENFFWDRPELDRLQQSVQDMLDVNERRDDVNASLTYLAELADLLRISQTERSSHNIEVGILLLIVVEVVFECIQIYLQHV
eukprot:m.54781 g.54781  ORF g.54781 m.54781 type:complete len:379 (+) comp10950_c0_seq2:325-1461(+)